MTTDTHYPTIGFIGCGNMGQCLISGLIANHYPAKNIWASDPSSEKLNVLHQEFGIHVSADNEMVANHAQIILLAVKPQVMKQVAESLKNTIQKNHALVISIAAGISIESLSAWLGKETALVRCMPNIAAFVQSGATAMFANTHVTPLQRDLAESIMRAVGITLWVNDEKLIDTIAALSGSGPAYFFYMMEALEEAAIELGLNADDAHLFTLQTALGSAKLALSSNESASDLRVRVTSKGGITERAVSVLENQKVRDAFKAAVKAAHARSIELANGDKSS